MPAALPRQRNSLWDSGSPWLLLGGGTSAAPTQPGVAASPVRGGAVRGGAARPRNAQHLGTTGAQGESAPTHHPPGEDPRARSDTEGYNSRCLEGSNPAALDVTHHWVMGWAACMYRASASSGPSVPCISVSNRAATSLSVNPLPSPFAQYAGPSKARGRT